MNSKFEHKKIEQEIYQTWEKSGAFKPRKTPLRSSSSAGARPFTILMPPPNANASLHAGHGMYTVDDILVRWKRMQGYGAQWIPGRDHAGFETQFVYEKYLAKEGKSRLDFDRKTLYGNIAKFVEDNSGLIFEQFRRLGFSADWNRSVFTLDPQVIAMVYKTFTQMVKDELVYRSDYLVNYCTHCGTSLAELEINHPERVDPLYYVRYPLLDETGKEPEFIVVATTRPEPIMLDTHLAVNPKDKKNKWLVGRKLANPLTGKPMEIIADEFVDPAFGTGVVKMTPAHDKADYEVAKKLGLPIINGIEMNGRMSSAAGEYAGMKVKTAREAVVAKLQELGLIEKIDNNYLHSAMVCYKCGHDMEPMTVPNWYIKVEPLKGAVVKAVKEKKTQFYPKKYEKQLLDWMGIMHDWPISRQVAWGIRIPAWYEINSQLTIDNLQRNPNLKIHVIFLNKEKKVVRGLVGELLKNYSFQEIEAGLQTLSAPIDAKYVVRVTKPGEGYLQETDTFDTWFSSSQWPLVTLREEEYSSRYPTDVMATMSDILRFWVSRMMMFGLYARGEVPFRHVYLWSTVTDGKGQKMSKSKGNVINPIELVDKYGADAFRMSLLFGNGEGGKVPLSDDKVRAMRNFGNKLWNMARFFLMMADPTSPSATLGTRKIEWYEPGMRGLQKEDKKILKELNTVVTKMTTLLEKFRFSQAADLIYEFMWHTVADIYIEQVKDRQDMEVALSVLRHVLLTGLKLLHPFMPFVTEAIWKEMPKKHDEMLMVSRWPSYAKATAGKPEVK
ncbi:valine--tRNA ligase [Candidatus Collierbacteria bacterium CG10_big_fil_rev_8_21_14_0_10_44_9]|uniref:Valine--tRNA ligase n=1 Tax=Candidatus Collierbacteria bacterium CG10_big_fil_rev_8_21_14_0_10_44_9 TaxID=1974535 RepID=A0A2H0VIK8_9BACT|nr:MAG: valine--tRNA ligase [Candidatus Collierbacteria bacterium CG10_big_fil_rev_8_21_14_0_10_44_9]